MSWFAKFHGTCAECGGKIWPDDEIEWVDVDERTIRHEVCEEKADLEPRPTCPDCFMEIALSGACGC
jgi:hypothetical protein